MDNKYNIYLNSLQQWLCYYGFEKIPVNKNAGTDIVYRRTKYEFTKFGKADYYVCCKLNPEKINPNDFSEYSSKMFSMASAHRKSGLPLSFGTMMIVYPLIVTENISAELVNYINNYCPKQFAAAEFPSVLDINTQNLYYYPATPIWGAAYYANFRKEVNSFFSPNYWKAVTSRNFKTNN